MNSERTSTQGTTGSSLPRQFVGADGDQCPDCGHYRWLDKLACVCEGCYDRGRYGYVESSQKDTVS